MHCVANFEVGANVSVVPDDHILTITEPKGAFKARVRNIPRAEYTTPFLLSIHIYFDSESIEKASDSAEEHLTTCLNMLALTTGSGFRRHRTRQIVDAEPSRGAMRDVRMWSDRIEYDDPQPFLNEQHFKTIERLLEHDIPPAIQRALRWYRLGVDANATDDQFTYFWFALEIVAEFQKPSAKVNDKCPKCQNPLYCEQCEAHPEHRPYPKQAIRELILGIDGCDDATVSLLDKTRNSLMHGATLKEIEHSLPDPHERVVDTLGKLLWMALIRQFPPELLDDVVMGMPSTYVHYRTTGVMHIQTVVPVDSDGHFNLDFKGMVAEMKPFGPPQSALPSIFRMTKDQYGRLRKLSYKKGEKKEMLERIAQRVGEKGDEVYALVLSTDLSDIRSAIERGEEAEWVSLFREFIDTAEVATD